CLGATLTTTTTSAGPNVEIVKSEGNAMLKELLTSWPVVRQILTHTDGTGMESASGRTRDLATKHRGAQVARSVCPYCAVGCGQLVYHREGKLISIEGDPES